MAATTWMRSQMLRAGGCAASLLAVLAAIAVAEPAYAAGARERPLTGRFTAPQGWSVAIPPGLTGHWLPSPSSATPGHMVGSLVFAQEGAEVVRLDVYADLSARTARQWAEQDAAPVLSGGRGAPVLATRDRQPAWQVELDKTPQRYAQRHVLVRLGGAMAHVVCQVGAGAQVAVACTAVCDDLQAPVGKARQP